MYILRRRAGGAKGGIVFRLVCMLIVVVAAGCDRHAATRVAPTNAGVTQVDAREAERIAERFVRDNGYTAYVPTDLAGLQPESLEVGDDRKVWLAGRTNTLA